MEERKERSEVVGRRVGRELKWASYGRKTCGTEEKVSRWKRRKSRPWEGSPSGTRRRRFGRAFVV